MRLPFLCLALAVSAPAGAQVHAFVDVTVIPMTAEQLLPNHTVVVRDGRIVAVGPAARVAIPRGATRIDGRGKYLVPGLAEMHAHVPPQTTQPDLLADIMFLYVANGVTTIRGMLGAPYQLTLREQLRRGEVLGPRFYVGAPSINGTTAPNPETGARLVRAHRAAGYDLVKIHPGPSRATYDAVIAAGRETGITFGGHVPADVGLAHAIASAQGTIDHLDGYIEEAAGGVGGVPMQATWHAADTALLRDWARRTREAGLFVVPTQFLWQNLMYPPDPDSAAARPEMRYVPTPWVTGWTSQARGRLAQNAQQGVTPADAEVLFAKRNLLLKALADEGGTVLMGTDSPQMFNVPGFALHRELAVMAEAGMTPYQILQSGTVTVAEYVRRILGQDAAFGTVAVGQEADLVLLDANPLADIANLARRSGVMVRGRWVPRSELEAGLARLAAKYRG
jgi:hypothetical protein